MPLIRCPLAIAKSEAVRETPDFRENQSANGISIFWPRG